MQTEGKKGGRTYNPYVYSEQGVAMLTSVLHTDVAIQAKAGLTREFYWTAKPYNLSMGEKRDFK